MIKVRYIKNIFEHTDITEVEVPFSFNYRVSDYLDDSKIEYKNKNIIVSSGDKWLYDTLSDGDVITVTDKVKDIIGVIGIIVDIIWWSVTVHPLLTALYVYACYSYFSMTRKKSYGTSGIDEDSPTYSWDGVQTTMSAGIPIPIVYGEHKVGGNIINQYIRTDGDKNYLNVLLALCEGEIESISDLEINGNPASNFTGITQVKRMGTNNQSIIPNFTDLHNPTSLSVTLTRNNSYVYTTSGNDIEAFELTLSLSNGIFQVAQDGGLSSWSVTYRVEYKLHSDPDYINLGLTTISGITRSALKRMFRKSGLTAGKYDIRITRTSEDSSLDPQKVGDLFLTTVDEITTEDLAYPNVALLGIEALAGEQISGTTPNFTCIVRGRKIKVPLITDDMAREVNWEDYYWNPDEEEYRRISDDESLIWDGETFVDRWCANPIWCMKDLLSNTRYGLGDYINTENLDDSSFLEMSRYCEELVSDGDGGYEKRFTLDCVIDSKGRALDIITQLCATFRAFFFYSNGTVILKIDKPEMPVQMFGMGNIIKSSFLQSWKTKKEQNQAIEVQFLDKNKGYEQDIVAVYDEQAISVGEPIRQKGIRLFTTRISQAIREGRYALLVSKYIDKMITLKAGIDAIGCQAGDVINVSHDVPFWGQSGRIQDGSTTTLVKLDRTIEIRPGINKLLVQFSDDTMEEVTVTDEEGFYTELNVSPLSKAPSYQDKYCVGLNNVVIKPFRVTGLKRSGDSDVEITAIEYNESVYDTNDIEIPESNYSSLSFDLPNVVSVVLSERIVLLSDGTIEDVIDVAWDKPNQLSYPIKRYKSAKIYLSDNNGESWTLRGQTEGTSFAIQGGLVDLNTYKIAVVSVSDIGEENEIETSPQKQITILGKQAKPSNVTGFDVRQEVNFLKFTWNALDPLIDPDLARYIIKQGSDWESGVIIGEAIDTTDFIYPVGLIGNIQFMIKAIDTSGNESEGYALDIVNVTLPPDSNFMNSYDLFSYLDGFILNGCQLERRNDFNISYCRNVLSLATDKTWEDVEAEGQTWEHQEANDGLIFDRPVKSSGYYEMAEPIDLQIIFGFKLTIDAQYKNYSDGSIVIKVSISDDNITYSDYEIVSANKVYRGRYLKFKVELHTNNEEQNIYLYAFNIYIQAPTTKQAYGNDLLVAIGGTHIIFGVDFTSPPRISGAVVNGVVGFPVFYNKDKDGVDVKVYDHTGSAIGTAEIDWVARGY